MNYLISAWKQRALEQELVDLAPKVRKLRRAPDRDVRRLGDDNSVSDPDANDSARHLALQRQSKVSEILAHATLITEPTQTDALRPGHVAKLEIDYNNGKDPVEVSCLVVGHEETDMSANPTELAYDAPILARLIGKEVGRDATVPLKGGTATVTLLDISMPSEEVKSRERGKLAA